MNDAIKKSIDFYQAEAGNYDERRWSTPAGKYIDRVQKNIVLEMVGECKGLNILDIATGTGRFALELAKRGANVTVLDSSENMLNITRSKFENEGLDEQLETYCGSAIELPFQDSKFDICICINAMNHIPEYNEVLHEIQRVLKPQGVSVTNYTNWLSYYLIFGIWVNLRKKSVTRDVYTKWFSPNEIRRLHVDNGLIIEEIMGAAQFPSSITNRAILGIFKSLDKISRKSIIKNMASILFIKAIKKK